MIFQLPRKLTIAQAVILPIALPVLVAALAPVAVLVAVNMVREAIRLRRG